jgi:probable F420-dependent oxidoreductase
MKLGIATPVVVNQAGAHATWERGGTIDDVRRIAEAGDRLGYHFMTCSEHIGIPAREAGRRGARYWDPLSTFGFIAARTERIRLTTFVLVLGYHHPLEIVKRYGTLDLISGGRVILGVGVGTLKEEFDLLGVPFDDRGERADDALRALRASLASHDPVYEGPFYSFGGLTIDPCAVQDHLPIWIGGRTLRSLRRGAHLADGWCPFGVSVDQAAEWLARVDRPTGFEVVLPPDRPFDPVGHPTATQDALRAMAEAGTTTATAHFIHHSVEHYLEQLEALAELNARL